MNLVEYQRETERTCPSLGSLEKDLRHMRLGFITEFGELLDPIKKYLAYDKPIDYINLGEELADLTWYLTNEARMLGIGFEDSEYESYNSLTSLEHFSDSLENTLRYYLEEYNRDELFFDSILTDLSTAALFLGFNIEKLWDNNIAKLRIRFPEKFDAGLAINRNIGAERVVLEA